MVPCRNSAGPSMATEPSATIRVSPAVATTATNAATRPPSASTSWVSCRYRAAHERLDQHADAAPRRSTISIGSSCRYSIDGVWNAAAAVTCRPLPRRCPRPA